jgi:hypothetical protein
LPLIFYCFFRVSWMQGLSDNLWSFFYLLLEGSFISAHIHNILFWIAGGIPI